MTRCPVAWETLVEFHENQLPPTEMRKMRSHLQAGCEACREQLARLDWLLTALHGEDLAHASAEAKARAYALFREQMQAPSRPPLIARLVFDNRATLALAGARGERGRTYQMLYNTVEHDIDLWEEPQEDGLWYVIGQALPNAGSGAFTPEAAVLQAEDGRELAAFRDGSEFHLAATPAGVYTLRLRFPNSEVVVPEVRVGP